MKNIKDYLIPEDASSAFEQRRLNTEIVEVPDNPFYLPFKGDDRKHFELRIQHVGNYYLDDEIPEGESNEDVEIDNYPIEFKMTTYGIPSMEKFSEHLKEELLATIDAMEINADLYSDAQFLIEYVDIKPKHVYRFLKNIHKDYRYTEQFLKDYDHYEHRIYHNMKYLHSLTYGKDYMFAQTFSGEIGIENMLTFLYA